MNNKLYAYKSIVNFPFQINLLCAIDCNVAPLPSTHLHFMFSFHKTEF